MLRSFLIDVRLLLLWQQQTYMDHEGPTGRAAQ
jgi:hypothetical protein